VNFALSRIIWPIATHASDFESGALRQTGGSLDVAIDGEGFFTVETDDGGGRIQIPQEVNLLAIGGDGTISADGIEIARIAIVTTDATQLVRDGDNLWTRRGRSLWTLKMTA